MPNASFGNRDLVVLAWSLPYVGVRALWLLVDHPGFEKLGGNQQWMFLVVDVVLSAALLAGGADGIHSVIDAFTTFFNTTAQKAQQSANQQLADKPIK